MSDTSLLETTPTTPVTAETGVRPATSIETNLELTPQELAQERLAMDKAAQAYAARMRQQKHWLD